MTEKEEGIRPGLDTDPITTKVAPAQFVKGLTCTHGYPAITVDGEAYHESGAKSVSGANVWHPCELLVAKRRVARG